MGKKILQTRIEIQASPERVWQILTDFPSFPEWNPFIRRLVGEAREGATLEVHIEPTGERGMTFRPKVLKAEPGRELRWKGRLYMPGLFDGEHSFTIEPIDEKRVRFTQREVFTGILVGFLLSRLEEGTWRGFREMNKALKDRAERGGQVEMLTKVPELKEPGVDESEAEESKVEEPGAEESEAEEPQSEDPR